MSAIAGIGGGLGLVLGGVLVDTVSYHWLFWFPLMGIVVATAGILAFVPESPIRTPAKLDVRGALVLSVGLVLPRVANSQAHDVGWTSARTLGLIAGGLVVLALWVALERRTAQPLADIRALAAPPVLLTNVTTLGLALLAAAHGSQAEIIGFSVVMSGGIGLAFAAMPNLIIDAVPPHQTGEATGINALVRSVGSSLGSQVSATVLAASAVAGVATDGGFTSAFAISAAVAGCSAVAAMFIPRVGGRPHAPVLDEVGAASPLGEPAYAREEF
jgi:MFS family permease